MKYVGELWFQDLVVWILVSAAFCVAGLHIASLITLIVMLAYGVNFIYNVVLLPEPTTEFRTAIRPGFGYCLQVKVKGWTYGADGVVPTHTWRTIGSL